MTEQQQDNLLRGIQDTISKLKEQIGTIPNIYLQKLLFNKIDNIRSADIEQLKKDVEELRDTLIAGGDTDGVVLDHTELANIGSNTHEQIDTHISSDSIHVTLQDKELWNQSRTSASDHLSNNAIHVTQEDKDRWNGIEVMPNTSYFASNLDIDEGQTEAIDSLPANQFRMAKWIINVQDNMTGNFSSCEILAHHQPDETTEFVEYARIGMPTVDFDVVLELGQFKLMGTGLKDNQSIRVVTTAINNS